MGLRGKIIFSIKNWMSNVEEKRKEKGFVREFENFSGLAAKSKQRFSLNWEERYLCLSDNTSDTPYDRHYVYHPSWAARVLSKTQPEIHIDIASTLYFCAIASAFVNIKFYDYRPADLKLTGLTSESADLTNLHFKDNSVKSISCMHTVEHVGLGRYGDPLDYDGDLKAIKELKRVTAPEGDLLFVVPVGKSKIMFNAHRIYSYDQVLSYFEGFKLMEFALVPDRKEDGGLIINASKEMSDAQTYGCGCFWFKKLA